MFPLIIFKLCCILVSFSKALIHENFNYFETLHADDVFHDVLKQGSEKSSHKFNKIDQLKFKTLGKDFRVILSPKRDILHSNFRAYAVDGNGRETLIHLDYERFYEGRVFGEVKSYVNFHIDNGLITGTIHLPQDIYHIEPSWRHFPNLDNRTMITYKASDVKLTRSQFKNENQKTCAYGDISDINSKYDVNTTFDDSLNSTTTRHKRNAGDFDLKKTRCPLLLVADYRFYQEMGGLNTKTTINYLVSLIDRVDKIYNDTVWKDHPDSEGFKGFGFIIKKIIVHTEPTRVYGEPHYNMHFDSWDVRSLLEEFSKQSINKDFCLAHLFTHQTFRAKSSAVLGLAYIASARSRSHGGICSQEYVKNGRKLYLNSGLSSSRNHYGQRVITREADLVTAHEFGHNWGSEHDPDFPACSPKSKKGGSFLMYTYSVSGYDINNKRFSPCSIRSISKVLQAKSGKCFTEPEKSFCGNLRVEGNEECDAGLLGTEDNDYCCNKDCKLRKDHGAVCSDKNSPCCQNCQYMQRGVICREAQVNNCEKESTCTGLYDGCPKSLPVADGTFCQEKGTCKSGVCVPFCETKGLQSCMCDNIEQACMRCCRKHTNETCYPLDTTDFLSDGTPCVHGFCNEGVCEKVVQDFVERFWKIIDDISINKVLHFLKDNIVGTVVLATTIIWIPASYIISYFDRKRLEECRKFEWRSNTRNLIHAQDHLRIIKPEENPRFMQRTKKKTNI